MKILNRLFKSGRSVELVAQAFNVHSATIYYRLYRRQTFLKLK
ncbi:hypothetical protein [Chryseobacterium sp. G0201]|nr:hypothetical protein [Chryseobacterium sp. G0201]